MHDEMWCMTKGVSAANCDAVWWYTFSEGGVAIVPTTNDDSDSDSANFIVKGERCN